MRTFEDVCKENKEANNGYLSCDLRNFKNICSRIQQALASNELEKATDSMCSLTNIFEGVTDIDYNQYRVDTGSVYNRRFQAPSKKTIKNDFNQAKTEIESFICKNYKSGAFNVTKEILKLPFWCVDWNYYNDSKERFVKICRETDLMFGLDDANRDYAMAYKTDYNALDVYFSRYNQRCYIKFKSLTDSKRAVGDLETEYGEYNEKDGTIWVDVPFSC